MEPEVPWICRSHINAIDAGNLAVSLSSSINGRFGSVRRSLKSGFVWNNDLSAFTLRDKESSEDVDVNAIEGRKRARTLMSPMMLFDQHGALITSVGVTGSLNSLMAAAQVLVNQMLFNKSLPLSVDSPRVFATSEGATFEFGIPLNVVSELWEEFSMSPQLYHDSRVHGLSLLNNGFAESACDFRDGSELCSEGF